MNISISNAIAVSSTSAVYSSSKAVTQVATSVAHEVTDSVHLSQSAQIHALIQAGETATLIAATMGLPVASVDSILGIVVSAPVIVLAATSVDLTINTKGAGTPAPALIDVKA